MNTELYDKLVKTAEKEFKTIDENNQLTAASTHTAVMFIKSHSNLVMQIALQNDSHLNYYNNVLYYIENNIGKFNEKDLRIPLLKIGIICPTYQILLCSIICIISFIISMYTNSIVINSVEDFFWCIIISIPLAIFISFVVIITSLLIIDFICRKKV